MKHKNHENKAIYPDVVTASIRLARDSRAEKFVTGPKS
jgi:hypothetical protein